MFCFLPRLPPLAMLVINCFAPPSANQRAKLAPGQRVVLQSRCLPQLEKLPPKESLFREAAALQKCATDTLGSPTAVPKTNRAAHAFIAKCIGENRINGGIQNHYVYRSLYSTQLRANYLHAGISLDRILVLDNAELQAKPSAALKKVHKHVGIPQFDYPADLLAKDSPLLAESIRKTFTHFDESIGWSLRGEDAYDAPMEDHLKAALYTFFQTYNQDLFDMLKIDPFDGWSVPGSHKDFIAGHTTKKKQDADSDSAPADPKTPYAGLNRDATLDLA